LADDLALPQTKNRTPSVKHSTFLASAKLKYLRSTVGILISAPLLARRVNARFPMQDCGWRARRRISSSEATVEARHFERSVSKAENSWDCSLTVSRKRRCQANKHLLSPVKRAVNHPNSHSEYLTEPVRLIACRQDVIYYVRATFLG